MKVQSQAYVTLGEIFDGLSDMWAEWSCLAHTDFTFGDCNRSMISKERFIDSLPEWEESRLDVLMNRLNEIPEGVMIDLEN